MMRFRRASRYCNQPKKTNVWIDTPPYFYSSEPVSDSEVNQISVWSELRFLRLEASSPALRETEAYLPIELSVQTEVTDRSAAGLRDDWGGDGWTLQSSAPSKSQLPLRSYCEIVIEAISEVFS